MSKAPTVRRLVLLFALLASARADVVRLKNGNVLEGKIVVEGAQEIRIRTGASEITVPRAQIAEIERGESPHEVYKRRAGALKEDDADGHFALGEYCIEHRLYTEAIAELRRTLELKSDHAQARAKLVPLLDQRALPFLSEAKRLQAQGQFEEAEGPLITILEQYPDSSYAAMAQHLLAVGFAARKQYDMALTRWRRALALDDTLSEAYEGAAQAAAETGKWADAVAFTERALGAAKDAEHAKRLRERAEALRELVKLQEAKPDTAGQASRATALAAEARVLLRLGQRERALQRFQDAYDAGAREPELLKLLVEHNEQTGRIRLALEIYQQLVAANPADDDLVRRRARIEKLLLVPRAFATRDKAERERLLFQVARSGVSFAAIQGALRECAERQPEKTGLVEGTFLVDELLLRANYVAYVPKGYDPRRPWPLILALHRDGETAKEYYYNWEPVAAGEQHILLFPCSPTKAGWRSAHIGIPLSALRHAMKVYNIDTDRVYLEGTGTGGLLAWAVALRWPDRFAALIVRNASLDEVSRLYLRSAVDLPTYLIVSQHAPPDIIGSQREAYKALDSWGYDVQREEVPGYARNPALPELNTKVLAWLEDKTRSPYPPRVRLVSFDHANASAFWICVERFASTAFDPDRRVNIKAPLGQEYDADQLRMIYLGEIARGMGQVIAAVVPGNRINLVTRHIEELTVFLDDQMVDLDKPVRIVANGELVFNGTVQRSIEQLFESARFHRDPRLCYSAAVRIKVREK
ncbi:MAG TPA: tetratricopeptide repeat protein [Planctomycetota bacterium]|nr:tetratricopeptide repeat protein [Planctomycetota bacterium]